MHIPLFKDDLGLSFAQIGLITLVYQLSASVFQPITGIIFDKYPVAWSLPIGMSFTLIGLINLAFSDNLYWILASVFLIGIGSSVLHPEASRITFLASGGNSAGTFISKLELLSGHSFYYTGRLFVSYGNSWYPYFSTR